MTDYTLGAAQVAQYDEEGFLLLPDFFPRQDMDQMLAIARADKALQDNANDRLDSAGKVSRLSLRYD
ncbi:MAG: phytanoyl-CoA dioxygenase family protein, partial [Candidatus Latescibacterota bacterium]|nr:phytanoyl-CoA dioxygenase family protein [Candidatus Latescibacterota bacterium]